MDDLLGHSITYRVAMGPQAGQKVFSLQSVPTAAESEARTGVAQYAGFSLHAGTAVESEQREKLERLARYVNASRGGDGPARAHAPGSRALSAEDAVSGRDDARRVRTARLPCTARRSRAAAARALDEIPRGVRPIRRAAGIDHAGGTRRAPRRCRRARCPSTWP